MWTNLRFVMFDWYLGGIFVEQEVVILSFTRNFKRLSLPLYPQCMRGGDSWHFRVAAEVFILVECKCCLKLIQTKGKQQVK